MSKVIFSFGRQKGRAFHFIKIEIIFVSKVRRIFFLLGRGGGWLKIISENSISHSAHRYIQLSVSELSLMFPNTLEMFNPFKLVQDMFLV